MTTLTVPSRVSPLTGIRQSLSLAWRGLVQIRHNPFELGDLSIQPIMFVLLFTYLFGGAIMNGDTTAYLQYMLPGIIVQSGLMATMNTGMGLSTDLTKGFFDRLQSLPIARWAPLTGRVLADVAKQAWSIMILLVTGYAIGFRAQSVLGVLGAFALMLTFSFFATWFAVWCGAIAKEPEKVMMYGFTAVFPLSFLSNAYVQTGTLPSWLQEFVKINPVTFIGDALRGLLTGGPVLENALYGLTGGLVIAVIFAPLALMKLRRR